jgi:hypothetical protein
MLSAMRRGSLGLSVIGFATVLTVPTAYADGGIDDGLKECKGLPARGKPEPIGDDVTYVASGQYVAFTHKEGGGCEVYSIARPAAKTIGHFGAASAAVAVKAARCSGESCPVVVAVRGKADKPLAAVRTDIDCDQGVELRPIQLFAGRDDLELVCRVSSGAGWSERHVLIDTSAGALIPFYVADTGSYIALSPAEKKAGDKPSCPIGSLKVEKIGDDKTQPLLRLVDPASANAGNLHGGLGTLPAKQLVLDIAHHDVKLTGAPDVPTEVDAHRGCR